MLPFRALLWSSLVAGGIGLLAGATRSPASLHARNACEPACTCIVALPPERAAEWRAARGTSRPEGQGQWFVGEVTAVGRADSSHLRFPQGRRFPSDADYVTTFTVVRSWLPVEGDAPRTLRVRTSSWGMCPIAHWTEGKMYLVHATPDSTAQLRVRECSWAWLASDTIAARAIEQLDAPRVATDSSSSAPSR